MPIASQWIPETRSELADSVCSGRCVRDRTEPHGRHRKPAISLSFQTWHSHRFLVLTKSLCWTFVASLDDYCFMYDKPEPRPRQGATDSEAIELCAQWMRYLGAADVVIADPAAAIPCDLYSNNILGWVHNWRGNVEADLVAHVISVLKNDGRSGMIFFRHGFDTFARNSATRAGIALVRFSPEDGTAHGLNQLGRDVFVRGLVS